MLSSQQIRSLAFRFGSQSGVFVRTASIRRRFPCHMARGPKGQVLAAMSEVETHGFNCSWKRDQSTAEVSTCSKWLEASFVEKRVRLNSSLKLARTFIRPSGLGVTQTAGLSQLLVATGAENGAVCGRTLLSITCGERCIEHDPVQNLYTMSQNKWVTLSQGQWAVQRLSTLWPRSSDFDAIIVNPSTSLFHAGCFWCLW